MPKSNKELAAELAISKMLVDIQRVYGQLTFKGKPYGARATDTLLLGGVFIGWCEGRAMNASKLAEYTGTPRTTVIRRLKVLEREGYVERVGKTYASVIPIEDVTYREELRKLTNVVARIIIRTAATLAKLVT